MSSFDTSPVIAEVLRQIAQANANVVELRAQLGDFRTAASENHANIKVELENQRERKRAEDAGRLELKTRTKTLEESKRIADSGKRDAEKKLRAAESARDTATMRMERLDKEIGVLQEKMREDVERARTREEAGDEEERQAYVEMELKKKEIKVAEEVIAALNSRAKELEEKVAQEEERLKRAREAAELKKQDRSFYPLHVVSTVNDEDDMSVPWSPITSYTSQGLPMNQDPIVTRTISQDFQDRRDGFPQPLQGPRSKGSSSSGSSGSGAARDVSESPRPARLSLTGISNLREPSLRILSDPDPNGQILLRPRGFNFTGDLPTSLSSGQCRSTRFSPFADCDENELSPATEPYSASGTGRGLLSPGTSSLIPTSLISSLDGSSPALDSGSSGRASFLGDDDTILARNWRRLLPVETPANYFTASPTSLTCPSFDGIDQEDPFEVRPPPMPLRRRLTSELSHLQRATLTRTPSDPPVLPVGPIGSHALGSVDVGTGVIGNGADHATTAHRRWYSAYTHDAGTTKKGLNPEAKVFSFTKRSLPSLSSLGSSPVSSASGSASTASTAPPSSVTFEYATAPGPEMKPSAPLFSNLSMRAFAPSAAERSALGAWTKNNTSLERLPTLSEVTSIAPSIPSSPTHKHAAAVPAPSVPRSGVPPGLSLGWLHSWAGSRKPKIQFSPWEDGETESRSG